MKDGYTRNFFYCLETLKPLTKVLKANYHGLFLDPFYGNIFCFSTSREKDHKRI